MKCCLFDVGFFESFCSFFFNTNTFPLFHFWFFFLRSLILFLFISFFIYFYELQTLKSHIFFFIWFHFAPHHFYSIDFIFIVQYFIFFYNFLLLRFNSLDHNLINALCFSRGFRLEPWICYPSQSYLLCSSLKKFFEILRFQNRKSHEILFVAKTPFPL